MKIALIGNPNTIWIKKFYKMLKTKGNIVKIFAFEEISEKNQMFYNTDYCKVEKITTGKLQLLTNVYALYKAVKKFAPELLWGHYITHYGFYAALLPVKAVKCISTWGSDINLTANFSVKLKRWFAINFCDLIIPSWYDLNFINKIKRYSMTNKEIFKTYWGLDTDQFYPLNENQKKEIKEAYQIPSDSFVVTSIRHAKKLYNVELICDSFLQIEEKIENSFFVFLAGFYDKEGMDIILNKFSGKKNVLILDNFMDSEEINKIFNISDVGVSFLTNDMFGAPIQEFLSVGGLCLLSPLSIYKNFVNQTGLFVKFAKEIDSQSLTKSILQIYNAQDLDSKSIEQDCQRNIKIIGQYNFQNQADLICKKFSELVK